MEVGELNKFSVEPGGNTNTMLCPNGAFCWQPPLYVAMPRAYNTSTKLSAKRSSKTEKEKRSTVNLKASP